MAGLEDYELEGMTKLEKLDALSDKVLDGLLIKDTLTERELATATTLLKNNNRVEDKPKSKGMADIIAEAVDDE